MCSTSQSRKLFNRASIGSYGDSRPGHLVLQSIITTIPQTFIYRYCQTASPLPNIQLLKRIIPHPHPLYLTLKTLTLRYLTPYDLLFTLYGIYILFNIFIVRIEHEGSGKFGFLVTWSRKLDRMVREIRKPL
jgi:hypothetical protein